MNDLMLAKLNIINETLYRADARRAFYRASSPMDWRVETARNGETSIMDLSGRCVALVSAHEDAELLVAAVQVLVRVIRVLDEPAPKESER